MSTPTDDIVESRPREITCSTYAPEMGGRRCVHFRTGGVCAIRAPELEECTEWRALPENEHRPVPRLVAESRAARHADALPLFQPRGADSAMRVEARMPSRAPATATASAPTRDPRLVDAAVPVPTPAGLSEADILDFKARRIEFCMTTPRGDDVWVVHQYRDPSRKEISIDHAATMVAVSLVLGYQPSEIRRLEPTEATGS